jgi:hypothetical protein
VATARCRVAAAGGDRRGRWRPGPAGLEGRCQLDLVRPDPPGRPRAPVAAVVPGLELGRGRPPGLEACHRVEQPGVVVVVPEPEVFAPQAQPQLAGEHPGAVARATRVGWVTGVALLVQHRAGHLGVLGPGAAVEVGRADHRPHVVDDHGLGMHVDRRALLVLQVIDGHPRSPGADQVVDGPPLGRAGGPTRDPAVAVGMARHHDDHAQLWRTAQGRREGVCDQGAPQVLALDVDQGPRPSQRLEVGAGDAAFPVGGERDRPVPGRVGPQHLHGMRAGMGWRQPAPQQPEASGLVADPPPDGPQRVAVVGWGAVFPAFPEGEVDSRTAGPCSSSCRSCQGGRRP